MIPQHTAAGYLPEGTHHATWTEVVQRFGWTARRAALLSRFVVALRHLHEAGCRAILLGGSFVTTKAEPRDIDALWSIAGVDVKQLHTVFRGPDGLRAIKALFGADLFPSMLVEEATRLRFVEFFQRNRSGRRVGVVLVDLVTLGKEDDG